MERGKCIQKEKFGLSRGVKGQASNITNSIMREKQRNVLIYFSWNATKRLVHKHMLQTMSKKLI